MAGYKVLGWDVIDEYRGGNSVVKVREFRVLSLPSETFFQFRRGKQGKTWIAPGASAQQFADRIEGVLALANVDDVQYSQRVTKGGKLQDWMTTWYSSDDGEISGSVESDLAHFGPNFTAGQIAGEMAAGGDL